MRKQNKTCCVMAHLVAFAFATALSVIMARAALPPKQPDQLRRDSQLVAQVKIEKITPKVVSATPAPGTNTQFTAQVMVEKAIKGKVKRGARLWVRYWIIASRPDGWVGPSGQYVLPQVGQRGTIFALRNGSALELLQPNGWQTASTRAR